MFDVIREIGAITRKIQSRSNAEYRELGLDNNAFLYLIRVSEQPGRSMAVVADDLQIDRTTAFRTIKKLVAKDYLCLENDPQDKRARLVFPTATTNKLYPRLHAFEQQSSDSLLINLTTEEKTALQNLLKKLNY